MSVFSRSDGGGDGKDDGSSCALKGKYVYNLIKGKKGKVGEKKRKNAKGSRKMSETGSTTTTQKVHTPTRRLVKVTRRKRES